MWCRQEMLLVLQNHQKPPLNMYLRCGALSLSTAQPTVFAADMFTVYPSRPHPPSANWRGALSEFGRSCRRGSGEGFNRLRCDVTGLDLPVCMLSPLPLSSQFGESNIVSLYFPWRSKSHISPQPVDEAFRPLVLCPPFIFNWASRPRRCWALTNSLGQSPSWEANRCSATQQTPGMLWKPQVHCRIQNSPPLTHDRAKLIRSTNSIL